MRIGPYRLTLAELSGGMADLGVLIPLEVALIVINGLNPTATLLGIGLIYILSGWFFKIPMPVQPLKSIAVVAVALGSPPSVIAAAALLMAGIMAVLSFSGGIKVLERVVPSPVVRGIQLGLGLMLMKSAYQMIFLKPFLLSGLRSYVTLGAVSVPMGVALGVASIFLLLVLIRFRSVPAALIVVVCGAFIGFFAVGTVSGWTFGPMPISLSVPQIKDFTPALWLLVLPQVPLTLANSVYATADAAKTYFGEQARNATPTRISLSIVLGNLWAGLFGGLPNCHGSGGLTAHYRLGARTPLATSFLGVLLIVVALVFGQSAIEVRNLLPTATLGALLLYVGIQHAFLGLNVKTVAHLGLSVAVAVVSLLFGGNLAIGAAIGLGVYWPVVWLSRRFRWNALSDWSAQSRLRKAINLMERMSRPE